METGGSSTEATSARLEPPIATPEQRDLLRQQSRLALDKHFESLSQYHLRPPRVDDQPDLISITDIAQKDLHIIRQDFTEDQIQTQIPERVKDEQLNLATLIRGSELSVPETQAYLIRLSPEDHQAVEQYLLNRIGWEIQTNHTDTAYVEGTDVQLPVNEGWLDDWKAYYPQLNKQQHTEQHTGLFERGKRGLSRIMGMGGQGVEAAKPRVEALIDRVGSALENKKAFGQSVASFALQKGATSGLRYTSKELAKGIVSWSGLAGAIGGGVTGTLAAGAFVGALSGAAVEYARQVNQNIDQRVATEPNPTLVGRKQAFLQKMKELRHTEVLKPNDYRKLGKAALFGAVAGAGAGALVEHIPQLSELLKENLDNLRSTFTDSGIGETIGTAGGNLGNTVGEAGGVAGKTIGDIGGGIGQAVGDTAGRVREAAGQIPGVQGAGEVGGSIGEIGGSALGTAGEKIGETGGRIGQTIGGAAEMARTNVPGVQGAGDIAGRAGSTIGEVGGTAGRAIGDMTGNIKRLAGLEEIQQAEEAIENTDQAAGEVVQTPAGFVPQADFDNLKDQFAEQTQGFNQANQTIEDLQKQLAEAKQALAEAKATTPVDEAVAGTVAVMSAAEQAAAHAQSAFDSFGASLPLEAGSNPWEVSTTVLKQMGVENPSPVQIMQLTKVLSQESGISVPEWGIKGTIDSRHLPVGFNLNLTDTVKKTALELATGK